MLQAAGLRITRPRLRVLKVLRTRPHSTADAVLQAAREAEVSISVQTVYDVLAACTQAGLLRRIEPAGSPALYETRTGDNHHHVVCRDCGRVSDVDCVTGRAPCLHPSDAAGYDVDEAEVVFWGRCAACARAADARSTTCHLPPTERNDR